MHTHLARWNPFKRSQHEEGCRDFSDHTRSPSLSGLTHTRVISRHCGEHIRIHEAICATALHTAEGVHECSRLIGPVGAAVGRAMSSSLSVTAGAEQSDQVHRPLRTPCHLCAWYTQRGSNTQHARKHARNLRAPWAEDTVTARSRGGGGWGVKRSTKKKNLC